MIHSAAASARIKSNDCGYHGGTQSLFALPDSHQGVGWGALPKATIYTAEFILRANRKCVHLNTYLVAFTLMRLFKSAKEERGGVLTPGSVLLRR